MSTITIQFKSEIIMKKLLSFFFIITFIIFYGIL